MIHMLLYLEPLDTLFFRDSRPFDAGMDTFAESTLPSPLAIYGALGAYILSLREKSIEEFIEHGDEVLGRYSEDLNGGELRIKRIFMARGDELFPPVPANLFGYPPRKKDPNLLIIKPETEEQKTLKSSLPEDMRPLSIPEIPDQELKQLRGFIDLETAALYLEGKLGGRKRIWPREEFLASEPRYGTRIDESLLTVREGFLYGSIHLRFKREPETDGLKQAGLAVLIDDIPGLEEGICSLGGERRKAIVRLGDCRYAEMKSDAALKEMASSKKFFIYLITPAIFTGGWKLNLPVQFNSANLVGAAVNKPEYISGWKRSSSASGEPRKMRKTVPAGSVYFFEAPLWDEGDFKEAYDWIFENSISDEYKAAGFGAAAMGVW